MNTVLQGLSVGSNLWLTKWANDERIINDTSIRDMYLGVYGAFGVGQGELRYTNIPNIRLTVFFYSNF